jgi:FHS family L-fucose permease-like MFS transporter
MMHAGMAQSAKPVITADRSVPLTGRQYRVPLILITSLFFLWALGVNLNDILIPHLKKAFQLTDLESSLIQTAFFGGYFLTALPAGWLMERIGYKKGILTGLIVCSIGALLFIPAASLLVYGFFLFALFVMACGQSFLEVAANPYVTVLGPAESAERRLNLSQSFNSVGAVVTPVIGAAFILTNTRYRPGQVAAAEASTVKVPYLVIAGIFLAVAAIIWLTRLPEVGREQETAGTRPRLTELWHHGHLVRGVFAQFLYVGAQVGVASFVIRFAEYVAPGTPDKLAANYLKLHLLGFMIGRFAGSAMMKYIPAPRLLAVFSAGATVCVIAALTLSGAIPVWAVVLIGFFHSIMFPTIFALSVKGLGPHTKLGSSLLVMAIIGGAIFPALMGYISDVADIQRAFIVPLFCYTYILYFSVKGHRPETVPSGAPRLVMEAE